MSENGGSSTWAPLGGYESWAIGINGRGQVAGYASNTIHDPYASPFGAYPSATQWRATLRQNGKPQDLGTLGGLLNEKGQVAGESFTNATQNPVTGLPTMDPFLWQHGVMKDLGTLGGVFGGANWMNSRGEVVGRSDLSGDQASHLFLWDGRRLVDLGTLGGDNGVANWISDSGMVAGKADAPGSQVHHGFLWKNGVMQDLPPTGGAPCSNAQVVNARGQAAGNDSDCQGHALAAVLWEHGAAYDLNQLTGPSALHLAETFYISNPGRDRMPGDTPERGHPRGPARPSWPGGTPGTIRDARHEPGARSSTDCRSQRSRSPRQPRLDPRATGRKHPPEAPVMTRTWPGRSV
jgi:probable HAF family extracellular repeat protein